MPFKDQLICYIDITKVQVCWFDDYTIKQ